MQADIGLIGLAVMGANLALNIAEKGFRVAVYNRTPSRTAEFTAAAGPLAERIIACATPDELAAAIRPPRPILMMVKAGEAVDEQIAALRPLLSRGDILIDAGNANFRDTMRRIGELEGSGLSFVGMGVSGGEEGARHGPSIMAGGDAAAYARIRPVTEAIAARYKGETCAARVGPGAAGHFVKTIHNGIEYADMQMIAEIYGIMRDGLGMGAAEIGAVFGRWNEGRLDSYLVEITAAVLAAGENGVPLVDLILDRAGQKGTGKWSAIEAQSLGVPATAIEAAVAARSWSSDKTGRERASRLFNATVTRIGEDDRAVLLADLEFALFAGKIAAYSQGFSVLSAASREFGWALPLPEVARIWRAGCIIRSAFLGDIAAAFEADSSTSLLETPEFSALMGQASPALRRVTARAVLSGLPIPALASALGWFDAVRQSSGTANLIQAQRDYFGAHGFERIDRPGTHHGPWTGAIGAR